MLDEERQASSGAGITNSRSNYEVACAVARTEARTSRALRPARARARRGRRRRGLAQAAARGVPARALPRRAASSCARPSLRNLEVTRQRADRSALEQRGEDGARRDAAQGAEPRRSSAARRARSDFFRDIAGAAFVAEAEVLARTGSVAFEPLAALYDRAILEVETRSQRPETRAACSNAPWTACVRRRCPRPSGARAPCSSTPSRRGRRGADRRGGRRGNRLRPADAARSRRTRSAARSSATGAAPTGSSRARARCSTSADRTRRPSRSTGTASSRRSR